MSDYIRKADAIDDLHTQLMYRMGSDDMKRRLDDWVKTLPPADVVEVVRCRECKYWVPGYPTYYGDDFIVPECGIYKQVVGCSGDAFCSYGERREE